MFSSPNAHVSIGSGDIINGNLKLILGLIWTLILHYQISIGFGIQDGDGRGGKGGKTGKQALLEWLQVRSQLLYFVGGSPMIFAHMAGTL